MTGILRELLKKYGKVALGVHFSVSAASITSLCVAVKNNVDVEALFEKIGMPGLSKEKDGVAAPTPKQRNRTAKLAASSGAALAVVVLLNKALFPLRVPITLGLTPPITRFLARRRIINNSVR
uniref:DUF1279 domain-containing protein n=1 Tax=Solanum lycopersicum TaxID=4081 RepID=K4BG78_SOLLC